MIYQFGVLFLVGTCMSMTSARPESCVCTLENAPVCGTDGVTYPNSCSFKCNHGDAAIAYPGECRPKRQIESRPPCVCSREARQVCGTDGHTYNNPCMLNCAKEVTPDLQLDHVGRCGTKKREIDPCACAKNLRPVCASNGVTYSNECIMRCASADLTVEQNGPCGAE